MTESEDALFAGAVGKPFVWSGLPHVRDESHVLASAEKQADGRWMCTMTDGLVVYVQVHGAT